MQAKDLTDKRFGKLVVIERAENTKEGRAQWLCKCDCGKTKVINGKYLLNGDTKSCGCIKHAEPKIKKIDIGIKIGRLTIIKKSEEKTVKGIPQWICQCECGKRMVIPETYLKRERIKSCGCSRKALNIKSGDVFGKLTVIKFKGITKNQNKQYLCKCECGRTKTIVGSKLISGQTKSCGKCNRWTKNEEIKPGDTFGKLTVIKRVRCAYSGKDHKKIKQWSCQCRCGNIKTVSENALLNGDARSCGCAMYNNLKQIPQGTKFGYLTVIKSLGMIEKVSKNNKVRREHFYLCQCDCGNTKQVSLKSLQEGSTKSCGCKIHNQYKKHRKTNTVTEINNSYDYKKSGITRIRRIFQNGQFCLPNKADPFYKDFVLEHKQYEFFMIMKLRELVNELVESVIKFKAFIIDALLVSSNDNNIIYFNVFFEKSFNPNKNDFKFPARHDSYTQYFINGLMGNFFKFGNTISYPIKFIPTNDWKN